jgi:AcrR family transcriptional regulator
METAPIRDRMLAVAMTVLAEEGAGAVTSRRLAAETGVSTMAVYTHFGGMDGVWHAVIDQGCRRLVDGFDSAGTTRDPVTELCTYGSVYLTRAVSDPELYRAMFADPRLSQHTDVLADEALARLVDAVGRCVAGGRFDHLTRPAVQECAYQVWLLWHGAVSLGLVGMIKPKQVRKYVTDGMIRLFVGYGDDRARASRSVRRGLRELAAIEEADNSVIV